MILMFLFLILNGNSPNRIEKSQVHFFFKFNNKINDFKFDHVY